MAKHIKKYTIGMFRGIKDLSIEELNHVNLIVGDNNCGKTSILESILILRNPQSIINLLRIGKQRDSLSVNRLLNYESFINMLPSGTEKKIHIHASIYDKELDYSLDGIQINVLTDEREFNHFSSSMKRVIPPEEKAYTGTINVKIDDDDYTDNIMVREYETRPLIIDKSNFINIVYLSPLDHIVSYVMNGIVSNKEYKQICLNLLKLFDSDIDDILLIKSEQTNRPIECLSHKRLGIMPVSTYGDGIKKVLLLANAIIKSVGGILLIDEIDTSIHSKYFKDVFSFLIKACRQYDIQLFITTHNIEAVDALLSTQNYDKQKELDDINVITIKKTDKKILLRNLPGREVLNNREAFNFEVRL